MTSRNESHGDEDEIAAYERESKRQREEDEEDYANMRIKGLSE